MYKRALWLDQGQGPEAPPQSPYSQGARAEQAWGPQPESSQVSPSLSPGPSWHPTPTPGPSQPTPPEANAIEKATGLADS